MPLPSSGQISMSQINTELGRSSTAAISIGTAATGGYATINTNSSSRPNSSQPHAMSEWYSYNHSAAPGCTAYGVYAFTDCSYNPTNFCLETTDWYHDGTCGYYPVYSFICSC